ncbi:hypothetical protein BJ508DRAFT_141361 [Ascobolus immersus RN42]|uniref:Vacuolar sorting protein Vps3844 C-terminal domain-containing protein n=1 Tax=Ascobolus immersus RN42 TaxID=1160509 RepID=A0A3N4I5K5_ASCIM|nr:hypothetical protein BJ508DRAFT_141361 [Ascobolus immersus RN42]
MDGADGNFKEDMLTLASFNAWVKDNGIPYGSIMYLTVNSLGEISKVYGIDSNEFAAAFSSMRWTIRSLIDSTNSRITLIEQPTSSLPVSKRQHLASEVPLRSPVPMVESSATPIGISKNNSTSSNPFRNLKRCFATEEACTKDTKGCSGHGVCKSVADKGTPGKCFQCVCSPTKRGDKSTIWGGLACQKKDISVELNLFIGIAIMFVVFLVGGVSLLNSLGKEELPGVLAAGVPPKKSS